MRRVKLAANTLEVIGHFVGGAILVARRRLVVRMALIGCNNVLTPARRRHALAVSSFLTGDVNARNSDRVFQPVITAVAFYLK